MKCLLYSLLQSRKGGKPSRETFTVITKIKEECELRNLEKLSVGDRIVKICNKKIDKWELDKVEQLLIKLKSNKKTNIVPLTLM